MDPVAPIAIGLALGLVFVAAFGLVILGRRRLSARESSEGAEPANGPQPAVDTGSGRDRNLPRWLDPSIAAARFKTDRTTAAGPAAAVAVAPARVPMVFVTPGDALAERQRVRYDGVPLLDRPDDVLGRTLRELDGGDEVEVLERAEIWAHVRTPNNLIGWIPSMTLAAVPAEAAVDEPEVALATEVDPSADADEPIALEVLLEAVAAQRLARREPQPVEAAPKSPRPRVRKPRAEAQPRADAQPPSTPRRRQATKPPRTQET
jgi:hypothetical protein